MRNRAMGEPAVAAPAASFRRHGRSEYCRSGRCRRPTVPATSWRAEGSDTMPQALMRRTRARFSALAKVRSRCVPSIAAQGTPNRYSRTSSAMVRCGQSERPVLCPGHPSADGTSASVRLARLDRSRPRFRRPSAKANVTGVFAGARPRPCMKALFWILSAPERCSTTEPWSD